MPELVSSFDKFRRPGLSGIIVTELDSMEMIFPKYTKLKPTTMKYEEFSTATGFDAAQEVGDSDSVAVSQRYPGYQKTIEPAHFNLTFEISELGEETIQYKEIEKILPYMVRSVVHAEELECANRIFNNGASSTTTADGQYLFDTDHTLKGTGGTVQNRPTAGSVLTPASLQTEITRLLNTVGDFNLPMPLDGSLDLWIKGDQAFRAAEILQSNGQAYTADNTKNVIQNITARVNYYITSTTAFTLLHPRHSLYFVPNGGVRQLMKFDDIRHVNRYQVYRYFRCQPVDWRGAVQNPGV